MLFVAFFPQLLAGPIVRGGQFLPQLEREHPLRAGDLRLRDGALRTRLHQEDAVRRHARRVGRTRCSRIRRPYTPLTCWLAVLAYAGQIYYDFSGYTDMAIGVARMLGIEYPENFRHPYLSRSIAEFWQRWHMTLSFWLRDYLFLPLAYALSRRIPEDRRLGVRAETWSYAGAILVTMFLGGLWHGASWTFVVWGALHGVALAVHRLVKDARGRRGRRQGSRAGAIAAWAVTFLFLMVTWVIFRAADFPTAWAMLRRMASLGSGGVRWFYVQGIVALGIGVLLHLWSLRHDDRSSVARPAAPARVAGPRIAHPGAAAVCAARTNPFIYLRF